MSSGGVWRVGDVVVKQCADAFEATFIATLSAVLPMVAAPIRTFEGHWVHEGWTATQWVDAQPDPTRWDDVLAAGDALHAALADLNLGWPDALDERETPWAIADRVAWRREGVPVAVIGDARVVTEEALALVDLDDERRVQIVHGDLAGNVLFPGSGSPVVIDLSPYRRPVEYASAIVVVDQVCWHGAPAGRAELVAASDVARAVAFRVVAAALHSEDAGAIEADRARPLLSSSRSRGG